MRLLGNHPGPAKSLHAFDLHAFVLAGTIYLLSVLEAVGDITATAMVSHRQIQGPEFQKRLSGGVLADGLVSVIALNDLMRVSTVAVGATRKPFLFFLLVCLLYWLICGVSGRVLVWLERKTQRGYPTARQENA